MKFLDEFKAKRIHSSALFGKISKLGRVVRSRLLDNISAENVSEEFHSFSSERDVCPQSQGSSLAVSWGIALYFVV